MQCVILFLPLPSLQPWPLLGRPPGVVADSQSRPADTLLPTWNQGCPAALDVHIISPLQDLTLAETAFTPSHALEVGV